MTESLHFDQIGLDEVTAGCPQSEVAVGTASERREPPVSTVVQPSAVVPEPPATGASNGSAPRSTNGRTSAPGRDSAKPAPSVIGAGQVFADILLLTALACQAPLAVVSVPQAAGWSTLSHGFDQRVGLNDRRLFDTLARHTGPVELQDLTTLAGLAGSPLLVAPHEVRWAFGVALRSPSGAVLGVVAVLDRCHREVTRRERRAMLATARQMTNHLSQLRRVTTGWPDAGTERGGTPAARTRDEQTAGVRRAAPLPEGQQLLRSHEVAVLFDVTERTVINWAAAGKLPSLRTIGGHLRFRSEDVLELLAGRSFNGRGGAPA